MTKNIKKSLNLNYGVGFGKTILFGEHFVVLGLPGIVGALNHTGEVVVEPSSSKEYEFTDNSPKFPGVEPITWQMCQKTILKILNHLGIDTPLKITLQGNLPVPNSGIGSSAAHLVAFSRAVNNLFKLGLSEEQINKAAFEGEKVVHGNPSGIDNTAATYGGFFWFQRREKDNIIKPILNKQPIEIVLAESGKKTIAKTVIEALRIFIKENPQVATPIFEEYEEVVISAKNAIEENNMELLGSLMNKNHELLQKLTISCKELDHIVKIARDGGALGAKLTGAGRGGLAVALTPGTELQNKVSDALEQAGYTTLKTKINNNHSDK
ncbi:MAG: mevalonate kinase [Alphaproteobacteria bacterium]